MSNQIHLPGNKGVPISPYPIEVYTQPFECITLNCGFILKTEAKIMIIPNNVSFQPLQKLLWACPKCKQVQTAEIVLPASKPMEPEATLVMQGGPNGGIPRKRNPKKKKGAEQVEDLERQDPDPDWVDEHEERDAREAIEKEVLEDPPSEDTPDEPDNLS